MSKYFIDVEFLEGSQSKTFFGIKFGKTPSTIDLISIGIVCEDGREYYAISKNFNLKEAWNRYDIKNEEYTRLVDARGENYDVLSYLKETDEVIKWKKEHPGYTTKTKLGNQYKCYWIRDNVLKPIWEELITKELKVDILAELENPFTYKSMKYLLKKYGKTNKQISEEIKIFTKTCTQDQLEYKGIIDNHYTWQFRHSNIKWEVENCEEYNTKERAYQEILNITNNARPDNVQFYGYYSDYDWVVFCWLFGKMIDLPKGFPMYCIDLKQWKDEFITRALKRATNDFQRNIIPKMDELEDYPKQTNEHNSLSDARWNYKLYKFLNTL